MTTESKMNIALQEAHQALDKGDRFHGSSF